MEIGGRPPRRPPSSSSPPLEQLHTKPVDLVRNSGEDLGCEALPDRPSARRSQASGQRSLSPSLNHHDARPQRPAGETMSSDLHVIEEYLRDPDPRIRRAAVVLLTRRTP